MTVHADIRRLKDALTERACVGPFILWLPRTHPFWRLSPDEQEKMRHAVCADEVREVREVPLAEGL